MSRSAPATRASFIISCWKSAISFCISGSRKGLLPGQQQHSGVQVSNLTTVKEPDILTLRQTRGRHFTCVCPLSLSSPTSPPPLSLSLFPYFPPPPLSLSLSLRETIKREKTGREKEKERWRKKESERETDRRTD